MIRKYCVLRFNIPQLPQNLPAEGETESLSRKENQMHFCIHVPPRTKKNSQQIFKGANGRNFISPSKAYKQYEKDCLAFMPKPDRTIDYPVNIKALYFMPTRRKVDLCNLHEALCDVLVKYGVIEDDNSRIVVSMDGSRVLYDKYNPRTEVEIVEVE